MPTEVIMPQMGESIFEGTITKWYKAVGDTIAIDEPLFEISTDKVDAEIPSPVAGVLVEIRFAEGATIEVNTVVAVIGEAAAKVAAPLGEQSAVLNPKGGCAAGSAKSAGDRRTAAGRKARPVAHR